MAMGRDAGLGNASFGASPSLGGRQPSLLCLLPPFFLFLSIYVEGNGRCTTVYSVPRGTLSGARHKIPPVNAPLIFFLAGAFVNLDAMK